MNCKGGVKSIAFSPDGKTLASWHVEYGPRNLGVGLGQDTCTLILWDVATGKGRTHILTTEEPSLAIFTHKYVLVFSPDGRTIASPGKRSVRFWEVATGKERHHLEGSGNVFSLAFSADGRRLATGSGDTTVLLWDLWPAQDRSAANPRLTAKELERLWTDLANDDAARAYQAQAKLSTASQDPLAFLKQRLHPMRAQKEPDLSVLLADLDSDDFAVREKAAQQLEQLGVSAVPGLQKALKGKPSLEARRRIEQLLERLQSLSGQRLQMLRALEVVERFDPAESRPLIEKLAGGAPDGWLTHEAKAILGRLAPKQRQSDRPAEKAK